METYQNIKKLAEEARLNRKNIEAVEFYKKLIEYNEANEWDYFFLILLLYQSKQYQNSLDLCRNFYKNKNNFEPLNNIYAQNIIKIVFYEPNNHNVVEIKKAINAVKKMISKNNKYVLFEKAFYAIFKKLYETNNYQKILEILEDFELKNEDFETLKIEKDNKTIFFPSVAEIYYIEKIKSNYCLKNYNEVIKISNEALEKLNKFCFGNKIWIMRLKAHSLSKLENKIEAVETMFLILRKKQEWFLYFEIAKMLDEIKENEACEYFLFKALKQKQQAEYKIKMFDFIQKSEYCKTLLEPINKISEILKNKNKTEQDILNCEKEIEKKVNIELNKNKTQGRIKKMFSETSGLLDKNGEQLFFRTIEKIKLETGKEYEIEIVWDFDTKKKRIGKIALIKG